MVSLKVPSSKGVSLGLQEEQMYQSPTTTYKLVRRWELPMKGVDCIYRPEKWRVPYPNMTAFHSMILLSVGAPLTPAGGSS